MNTPENEHAARKVYSGNEWVAVSLPREIAHMILRDLGWERSSRGGWDSPHGNHYWELGEALQIALVADALGRSSPAERSAFAGRRHD